MTAIVLALWVGCTGNEIDTFFVDTDAKAKPDLEGPRIRHVPGDEPVVIGQDVLIEASAKDEAGVFSMELHYRRETSVEWVVVGMTRVGDTLDDAALYQGTIRGRDISSGGMYYFLSAVDNSEYQNESFLPAQGDNDPWRFPVTPN